MPAQDFQMYLERVRVPQEQRGASSQLERRLGSIVIYVVAC